MNRSTFSIAVLMFVAMVVTHVQAGESADPVRQEAAGLASRAKSHFDAKTAVSIDSAILLYDSALTLIETDISASDTAAARILYRIGMCHYWKEQQDSLELFLDSAIAIWSSQLGSYHPINGFALRVLADSRHHLGRYTDAESTYLRAIELMEPGQDLGNNYRLQLALAYHGLGDLYKNSSRLDEALNLDFKVKEIRTEVLGADSYSARKASASIGSTYMRMGRYREAEPYLREGLSAIAEALGPEHMLIGKQLYRLAIVYRGMGNSDTAQVLLARAISIMEHTLGRNHAQLAPMLGLQALMYAADGRHHEAQELARRALAIRKSTQGQYHPFVAFDYRRLARILASSSLDESQSYAMLTDEEIRQESAWLSKEGGRLLDAKTSQSLDSAEVVLRSTIDLISNRFGPTDTTIARALCRLGFVYFWKQRQEDCRLMTDSAIAIWESELGANHPIKALGLRLLGESHIQMGEYSEAQKYYEQTIELLERQNHLEPDYRRVLGLTYFGVANVYNSTGQPGKGIEYAEKMIDVFAELYGEHDPEAVQLQSQLGRSYALLNRHREAIEIYVKVLSAREKLYGSDHTYVGLLCTTLAGSYKALGILDSARTYNARAIAILEKTLGPDHVSIAPALALQSTLLARDEKYDEAIAYTERAIVNRSSGRGRYHPYTSADYLRLARIRAASGALDEALAVYDTLTDSKFHFYEIVFHSSSEEQKLAYARTASLIEPSLLTLALTTGSSKARELAALTVLNGKSLVLDVVAAEREAAFCSADDTVHELLDEFSTLCTKIAAISLGFSGQASGDLDLDDLYRRKERLEAELSRKCDDFAESVLHRRVGVRDISSVLGDSEVLWEFIRFRPLDFEKVGGIHKWGKRHYMAFVIDHSGIIACEDLGSAAVIESLIEQARSQLESAPSELLITSEKSLESRLSETTSELYRLVVRPLIRHSPTADHVYISPFGSLNLVPFEILTAPDERYLIEQLSISYLSSGRDLTKQGEQALVTNNDAVLLAMPDFDAPPGESVPPLAMIADDASFRLSTRGPARSPECLDQMFDPLKATLDETNAIAQCVARQSTMHLIQFTGSAASESQLRQLNGAPRLLHLATHGYFCSGAPSDAGVADNNPLLFSGLALAGANGTVARRVGGGNQSDLVDDGILTALEMSAMDLRGTDMVVLSACHTGLGVSRGAEGIFGLRRAIHIAGARSLIMSLFAVPNRSTIDLMEGFYSNWLGGSSKSEALRQAILSIIRDRRISKGSAHPFFWGGFVLAGDPN